MTIDPYKVLGVGRDTSQDEIKRAYRKLAKELHPDLHPGDHKVESRFKEVSAAYALLSDPETRARFDRGEIDAAGQEHARERFYRAYADAGEGAKYGGPFADVDAADLFSDLFSRFGGGQGRGGIRMAGESHNYQIKIDFMEAARGARKRLTLPDGRRLDVKIPEGIADGQKIRLKGQGGAGLGGARAGDAYVEVSIEPHRQFRRQGADVYLDLPITVSEAVLGAKVEVPTVHGPVTLKIPKGSNSGQRLRLKGKGIRDRKRRARGDQYVELKVMLPESDAAFAELVERWARDHSYSVRD